jgi:FKBP-type peptidyl-prolyl cis-trans isomerase
MKVGGIREVVIPPADGFGATGSAPVLGTDTMVMVMQLVAVAK